MFFSWYDAYLLSFRHFLISDNPLHYFMLGFNDVCFPINPKLAIIMQVKSAPQNFKLCNFKPDKNKLVHMTDNDVIKYNMLQQYSKAKYLFGSKNMLKQQMELINILKIQQNG